MIKNMEYSDIKFTDGISTTLFDNGIELVITDAEKGSLNKPFPNMKAYDTINNRGIHITSGMLHYFGYTEEEVVGIYLQCKEAEKLILV